MIQMKRPIVNMWEQVRSNRRRSFLVVFVMALLLGTLGFVIGEAYGQGGGVFGIGIALIVWVVMWLVAYFQGDSILLSVSGAHEITKELHPQLFNVVEEMTIAAGLPKMPRVYIIDDMALNAFATGRGPETASVAVTAGLLGKLNRDQLQGVVAHEMSHIVNRDVLLMTIAGIMLGAIVMISQIFLRGMFHGGGSSRRYRSDRGGGGGGGQAQLIMFLVALVLAILAPILANLLYLALSRRREYLADANAVVLTRYPEGLAGALEVLAMDTGTPLAMNKATAPMYISNPLENRKMSLNLASTHPPIEERIRILRAMSGSASYVQYDAAWRKVTGKRAGVVPGSALAASGVVPLRTVEPQASTGTKTVREQVRQAGDLVRTLNQFTFVTCSCGLKMKVPPDFKWDKVKCPRCGQISDIPKAGEQGAQQGPPPVPSAGRAPGGEIFGR